MLDQKLLVFDNAFQDLLDVETEFDQTQKILKDKITAVKQVTEAKMAEVKNVTSGAEVEIVATIKAARDKVTSVVKAIEKKPVDIDAPIPVQQVAASVQMQQVVVQPQKVFKFKEGPHLNDKRRE